MTELRSILDNKKSIGYYLKATWYFETFFEKALLVILGLLGVYTIFKWIFGWLF